MKKFNVSIYQIIFSAVVLLLVIVLPFLITMNDYNDSQFLMIYIISKVLFGLLFVIASIMLIFKPKANGITYGVMLVTSLFQLAPLVVRLFYLLPSNQMLWSVISVSIFFLISIGLVIATFSMNKRMVLSDAQCEGNTIEVQPYKETLKKDDDKNE